MPCVGAGLCLLDSNIKRVASEGSAVLHHWASGSYDWNYHKKNCVHRNWWYRCVLAFCQKEYKRLSSHSLFLMELNLDWRFFTWCSTLVLHENNLLLNTLYQDSKSSPSEWNNDENRTFDFQQLVAQPLATGSLASDNRENPFYLNHTKHHTNNHYDPLGL